MPKPKPLLRRLGGIGFVAAFVAGVIAYGSGAGSSNAEIAAYYANRENRLHQIVGFALITAAIALFVVFVFLAWVALAAVLDRRRPTLIE